MSNPNENTPAKLVIENAYIMPRPWRNFSGSANKYNSAGNRNFMVKINPDDVEDMVNAGWTIKERVNRNDENVSDYFLKVRVRWHDDIPVEDDRTKLYLVNPDAKTKTLLTPETVSVLDYAAIQSADLVINPNHYIMDSPDGSRREGNSAYLESGYFVLESSPFDEKYSDFNDGENNNSEDEEISF